MELSKVYTISGNKTHLATDARKTLCGREISNGGDNGDMCKRCQTKADKLAAQAVCMHGNGPECAPCEADDAAAVAEGQVVKMQGTPCVSESFGYGECDGMMTKRFGLTECGSCGLTPYGATEGEEHQRITLALNKAQGENWERHHEGVNCTAGEWECDACLASRPDDHALWERAERGEVIGERVPMSVMATDANGEEFEYANVPNGDPERVARFVAEAQRCPNFRNVRAVPDPEPTPWALRMAAEASGSVPADPEVTEDVNGPETTVQDVHEFPLVRCYHSAECDGSHQTCGMPVIHYGENRALCGSSMLDTLPCEGDDERCPNACSPDCCEDPECACSALTTDIPKVTCQACREYVHKPVDEPMWIVVDDKTGEPVTLPTTRPDFRGDMGTVTGIAEAPSPGKSGKLRHDRMGQVCYPDVFGLRIVRG